MTHTESDSLRKTSKGTKIPFKDLLRIWRRRQELSQSVIGRRFGVSHAAVSDWEAGKSDLPNRVIQELYWDFYKILIEPIQEPALVDVSKALGLTNLPVTSMSPAREEPDGMTDDERSEALKEDKLPKVERRELIKKDFAEQARRVKKIFDEEAKERNNDKTLHSEKDVNEEENPPLPDEMKIKWVAGHLQLDSHFLPETCIEHLAKQYNALLRFIKASR